MKTFKNFSVFFILGLLMLPFFGITQKKPNEKKTSVDNGYYITYPDKLLTRIFLSQKFAPFTISGKNKQDLNYKSNSNLMLGFGFTYQALTINAGWGFNFLNKDRGQGDTKGLDLQLHVYPKKWAVDFLGAFLRGYYLNPNDNNGLNLTNYYQRPDLHRTIVGLSVFRVPNSDKFSYKAAVTQNAWQTKSAGSLLYGGEIYVGSIHGDSALVPIKVNNNFDQAGINKINFVSIGPGIGYAYTLVIDKNFFITSSLIGVAQLNLSTEEKTSNNLKSTSLVPGAIYKGALGYNSDTWSFTAAL